MVWIFNRFLSQLQICRAKANNLAVILMQNTYHKHSKRRICNYIDNRCISDLVIGSVSFHIIYIIDTEQSYIFKNNLCHLITSQICYHQIDGWGRGASAQEMAEHHSVGGEQLHCASMFCIFFYHYYYYVAFLFCPIKLSLAQLMTFTFF